MDCSICLEKIEEQSVKFCCKQNYHFKCIKTWVDTKRTCPICRKLLDNHIFNMLRNVENNIKELAMREKRAHHIIETLMMDIQNVKDRTKYNLEKISNVRSYTQPEIPPTPRISTNGNFNYSRLFQRRNAIVLPLIITSDECAAPAFCRCIQCLPVPIGHPRWN